jgi:hypothetical protein
MPEQAFNGSTLAKTRSRIAVAYRRNQVPEVIEEARRDLAAEKIANYVTKVLDAAPPLTDEQRARLAELLRPVRLHPGGKDAA